MNAVLEADALTHRVKSREIVRGISLTLAPGETLGLIGPNGSGKSTLLSMLAGLTLPASGTLRLGGQPMARLSRREIARSIALVAQSAETSGRITVREAVELGRTPWLGPLEPWGPVHEAAVVAALDAVGMAHFASHDWSSLSGGERQRVHIARAHAQQPQIMLLDEPTNHLDLHHQIAILDLIESLGITSVIALHDMQHALRCDRVLVLREGRAVALGPPAEVLTPALIREVFAVEAVLIPHPAGEKPVFAFQRLS